MNPGKVFVISLQRCGPRNTHRLLGEAGFSSVHWPAIVAGHDDQSMIKGRESDLFFVADTIDPVIARADAVSDVPIWTTDDIHLRPYPDAGCINLHQRFDEGMNFVERHVGNGAFGPFEPTPYSREHPKRPVRLDDIEIDDREAMFGSRHDNVITCFRNDGVLPLAELCAPEIGEKTCEFVECGPTVPLQRRHEARTSTAPFRDQRIGRRSSEQNLQS